MIAVIASTHTHFQSNRTQIIYKKETVYEIAKQINQYKLDGIPLRIFLHPPSKSDRTEAQSPLITSLVAPKNKDVMNTPIGFVRGCDLKEEDEQIKAVVFCDITIEEVRASIEKNKEILCFVLKIGTDSLKSFINLGTNKPMSFLEIDDKAKAIKYVIPPIKCAYIHVGLKNSMSNPYIKIL